MNELRIVVISHDYTDKELSDMIVVLTRRVLADRKGFWLTIDGYDSDPRDLWDIPEVATLCQRLVDSGFISVLEPGVPFQEQPTMLSSLQVLQMAKGKMSGGVIDVDFNEVSKFFALLDECNAKCEALSADYSARNEIPRFFQKSSR